MDTSDWRAELQPHARKRAVHQIMNAVKLFHGLDDDGLQELEKSSQSFGRKSFAGATSQSDYLHKITLKEVSMKRKMQEEAYEKEMYLPKLQDMCEKLTTRIQQFDSFRQQAELDKYQKLKIFKTMFERLIALLQISESDISPALSKKLPSYEKQIIIFINVKRRSQIPINSSSVSVASSSSIAA